MQYLPTNEVVTVEDYPYGFRQRTTMRYSIEHKSGFGFRKVSQTINPKTGQLNKPKKSTYYPVLVLTREDNDHIKSHSLHFYDDEGKTRDIKFMFDNFGLFTDKQIKSIAITILALLKADIVSKATYCNSNVDKLLALYDTAIKTLVKIVNTGDNLFNEVIIDFAEVEKLEEKGYNPFKTRTSRIV